MEITREKHGLSAIWKDPERAEELRASIREAKQDHEYRKHMTEKMKEVANDPELIAHKSELMKEMYNTPERRDQFRQQYEDHRESHTERMKELWDDPKYVFKVMKSRFNKQTALNTLEKRFGWEIRQEFEHLPD